MKQNLMQRIVTYLSSRLELLQEMLNKHNIKTSRADLLELRNKIKGTFSLILSHVFGFCAMLRVLVSKNALQTYAAWLRSKKAAAEDWAKTNLNKEALERYGKNGLLWLKALPAKLTWSNIKLYAVTAWQWLKNRPVDFQKFRKKAILASVLLFALWLGLGSSAAMAWFTHVTPADRNSFTVGEMDLVVEYRTTDMEEYAPIDSETPVFDDEALYEPGYTQVVFFKIQNAAQVAFDYKICVNDFQHKDSENVFGEILHLPKYLCFGLITAETEPELTRELAQYYADKDLIEYYPLGEYSETRTDLTAGEVEYAALIVYMPEEVGNEANYRGGNAPWVKLGIEVYAQQAGTINKTQP